MHTMALHLLLYYAKIIITGSAYTCTHGNTTQLGYTLAYKLIFEVQYLQNEGIFMVQFMQ